MSYTLEVPPAYPHVARVDAVPVIVPDPLEPVPTVSHTCGYVACPPVSYSILKKFGAEHCN